MQSLRRLARPCSLGLTALLLTFTAAACGNADSRSSTTPDGSTSPVASSQSPSAPATAGSGSTSDVVFGPECPRILGDPSIAAQLPELQLVDALRKSPPLATLVTAFESSGLARTLNEAPALTVFVPDDKALTRLGPVRRGELLTNRGRIVEVLRTHVVEGRLAPEQLPGDHTALSGATIVISGTGNDFTVDGNAHITCGNIQTANATVYVIDRVLAPG